MADLLDSEHSDVEVLAKDVLTLAYELYEQKEQHGLIFEQDGLYLCVAGFSTVGQATKWGERQGLKSGEAVLAVIKTGDQVL